MSALATSAIYFGTALTVALVDLATKALAQALLEGVSVPFLPILSFDLHYNRGVSFSMFQAKSEAGVAVLLLLQGAGTAVIAWWMLIARAAMERAGLVLIVGGALGNILDRLADGAVTDFLDLHLIGWRLFTFNLADAFISVGVLLLVIDAVGGRVRRHRPAPEAMSQDARQ